MLTRVRVARCIKEVCRPAEVRYEFRGVRPVAAISVGIVSIPQAPDLPPSTAGFGTGYPPAPPHPRGVRIGPTEIAIQVLPRGEERVPRGLELHRNGQDGLVICLGAVPDWIDKGHGHIEAGHDSRFSSVDANDRAVDAPIRRALVDEHGGRQVARDDVPRYPAAPIGRERRLERRSVA